MRLQGLAYVLMSGFVASITLSFLHQSASAQTVAAQTVVLQCVNTATIYSTVIPGSNGSATPLITFGNTPDAQQTCQSVTSRLNSATAASGGNLDRVLLRTGSIRSRNVICVVRAESMGCNTSNELLTVPSDQDPDAVLTQLLHINAEVYSLGSTGQHTRRRTYMRFGQAIRQQVSTGQ